MDGTEAVDGEGLELLCGFHQPGQHGIGLHLKAPGGGATASTFRQAGQHAHEQLFGRLLAMKKRAVSLPKVPGAAAAVALPPRTTTGRPIGPQLVAPQPPAIVAMALGTKVSGGSDRTRTPGGWRQGIGTYRRRWSSGPRLLLTQPTRGFLRQPCEWVRLAGAFALGPEGISSPRGHPPGWARPEGEQHNAAPQQDQAHQLIVDKVWGPGRVP
jgi:hypothetical protein